MLKGNFNQDAVLFPFTVNDIIIQRRLAAVQIADKLLDSSLIVERVLPRGIFPLIGQGNLQPLCQESCLTQPLLQCIVIKDRRLKHFRVRHKGNLGPGKIGIALSGDLQLVTDLSSLIALLVDLSLFENLHFQIFRKRVYNRCSDAMQSPGNLVSSSAELSAGVEHGKYDLNSRLSRLRVDADRDSAAVIDHCNGIIRMYNDADMSAVSGQGFIY